MKFIFINKDNSSFTEYNLKKVYFVPIAILLICLVTVPSIFFYLKYNNLEAEFSEYKGVIQEKYNNDYKRVEKSIFQSSNDIQKIIDNLNALQDRDNSIREVIGLPLIHEDIRKMGIGGKNDLDDGSDLDDEGDNVDRFVGLVDSLRRVSVLQKISYNKIDDHVGRNIGKILRTPFVYPVDVDECKFTSGFGERIHPITKKRHMHDGHDFAPIDDYYTTKVYATADGKVKKRGYYPNTYGHYIEIDHGDGIVTAYGHLRKISRKIKKNGKVKRGDFLGYMGNTGKSKGTHLHYEIKKYGKAVDPNKYYYDKNIY